MSRTTDTEYFVYKPFLSTLVDAVMYAKIANDTKERNVQNLLSKSAILHCSICVEALANNMLQFLNFGTRFAESIEKLDPISKIELFSIFLKKKNLERGNNCAQIMKAFIDLRNSYVHPKIKKKDISDQNHSSKFKLLQLDEEFQQWNSDDANRCVLKLLQAIDELLIDVIGLEKKSMSCMFSEQIIMKGGSGPVVPSEHEWAVWAYEKLKYKVRFYFDHILKRFENHVEPQKVRELIKR